MRRVSLAMWRWDGPYEISKSLQLRLIIQITLDSQAIDLNRGLKESRDKFTSISNNNNSDFLNQTGTILQMT